MKIYVGGYLTQVGEVAARIYHWLEEELKNSCTSTLLYGLMKSKDFPKFHHIRQTSPDKNVIFPPMYLPKFTTPAFGGFGLCLTLETRPAGEQPQIGFVYLRSIVCLQELLFIILRITQFDQSA